MKYDYRDLACHAAQAAADKKAVDIKVLDIRSESDVSDYIVITGAESSPQMRAIQMSVVDALKEKGLSPLRQDGRGTERWMALDYGGLVVHILSSEARHFYRLEQMWEKAKYIDWNKKEKKKRRKTK